MVRRLACRQDCRPYPLAERRHRTLKCFTHFWRRRRNHCSNAWLSFSQRAGLVHDERVDALQGLQRRRVPDEHAGRGAAAGTHHDRHRRRQPESTRTGDDEHGHRAHQGQRQTRLRSPQRPAGERRDRDGDDRRHEPACQSVRHPLDRRAAALRLAHHPDDLGKQGLRTDPLGAHREAARAVHRGADHRVARPLLDRDRLAADHRLVDCATTVDDHPVDRHPLTRPHPQQVPDAHLGKRHVLIRHIRRARRIGGVVRIRRVRRFRFGRAVCYGPDAPADPVRHRGCQTEQRPQRRAGPVPRPQLQHLSEQYQHDDDHGRVEVRLDAALHPEAVRKAVGDDGGRHAVEERRSHAERDQREHVRAAIDDRRPAPLKEGTPRPQHDGHGAGELDPVGHGPAQRQHPGAGNHLGHRDAEHREPDHRGDPEAPRHISQLRVGRLIRSHRARLQRHAALRTRSRLRAHDLRVHRAGVLDRRRRQRGDLRLERHAAARAGNRLGLAHLRAHRTDVRRNRRLRRSCCAPWRLGACMPGFVGGRPMAVSGGTAGRPAAVRRVAAVGPAMSLLRVSMVGPAASRRLLARPQERLRIAPKRRLAPAAAEQVGRALVFVREPGLVRVHGHAADRVACLYVHGVSRRDIRNSPNPDDSASEAGCRAAGCRLKTCPRTSLRKRSGGRLPICPRGRPPGRPRAMQSGRPRGADSCAG